MSVLIDEQTVSGIKSGTGRNFASIVEFTEAAICCVMSWKSGRMHRARVVRKQLNPKKLPKTGDSLKFEQPSHFEH